jgi:hypothetical protein
MRSSAHQHCRAHVWGTFSQSEKDRGRRKPIGAAAERQRENESRNAARILKRIQPIARRDTNAKRTTLTTAMPRGDKSSYTAKQKRKAAHIEESYGARGDSPGKAAARAWATVNKQDGGGKKSGSGRGGT